jgi:hypothetical protein
MKSTIFWDITLCSPFSVNRRLGGTYRLNLQGRKNKFRKKSAESRWQALFGLPPVFRWFPAELIFATVNMEATCSFEKSVDTERTTRRYIPEDGTLQNFFSFHQRPTHCTPEKQQSLKVKLSLCLIS